MHPVDFLSGPALAWVGAAAVPAAGALFPVAVGLASSATHCAGMCGRILGYTLLGLLAGSLGGILDGLSASAAWPPGFPSRAARSGWNWACL